MTGPLMKFCERVVAGDTGVAAWMKSHPKASKATARVEASRALTKPNIKVEIQRLRDQAQSKAGSAVLTLAEKRSFLARVVRMNGGGDVDDDLVNGVRIKEQGTELILPCKLKALELDAKLAGEFDEDKTKAKEADALQSLMMQIAGGKVS